MPIDLFAERELAKKRINDYLNLELPVETKKIIENSLLTQSKTRQDLLGERLNDILSSVSQRYNLPQVLSGTSQVPEILKNLESKSKAKASSQTFQSARKRVDMIYNNALDQLTEAGLDYKDAVNYAREYALKESERTFRGNEEEAKRQQEIILNNILSEYSQKGNQLQSEYQPKIDIGSALTRSLLGLTASGISGFLLDRNKKTINSNIGQKRSLPVAGENLGTFDPFDYLENVYPYTKSGSRGIAGT